MSKYTLPDLPYDYAALEPHMSAKIVELHHDKHHAAYVKGANTALEQLAECQKSGDFARIATLQRALQFNVSGHVLHSIYWTNLTPKGGDKPQGALLTQIERDFGSFDAFKNQLTQATATIMGSGWGALAWDPISQSLVTQQIHDHQSEVTQGSVPIMVIDAWEHAWYLQYQNEKTKFFAAIWNLWNWADISARFETARALQIHTTAKK